MKISKGDKIDLVKRTGSQLNNFCVGVNWGAIVEEIINKSFELQKKIKKVDLDLSCVLLDAKGNLVDQMFSPAFNESIKSKNQNLPLGKYETNDGALKHSGDDTVGDEDGDDGLDNEIITVDLKKLNPIVSSIYFFLNIYLEKDNVIDFSEIPYAKIRMYEGTTKQVNEVFAYYDIVTNSDYKGMTAIVLGKLQKNSQNWQFQAVGNAFNDRNFMQTLRRILNQHAN